MNIFYTDTDPTKCAINLMSKHCVKMPTESAQMLCTVHRIVDGLLYVDKSSGRSIKRWKLSDERENCLYKAGHINHPSVVWTRLSDSNYKWHFELFISMLDEYSYRYGKVHACSKLIPYLKNPPKNISTGIFTPVTPAMPVDIIVKNDSVASYRNYYIKAKQHLADWSGKVNSREVPEWYKN